MKKNSLFIFLLIIISLSSKAQQAKTDSVLKKNSLGIVFTHLPSFISEYSVKRFIFPQYEVEWYHRICRRTALSMGIIYPYNSNNRYSPSIIKYRAANIQIRGGIDFKLKLIRRFYFSPSFDFYFTNERYPNFYHPSQLGFRQTIYSFGPDLNFEYFFRRNFSIDMSLIAFSEGIKYPLNKYSKGRFLNNNGYIQLHRQFSLGVHYNF